MLTKVSALVLIFSTIVALIPTVQDEANDESMMAALTECLVSTLLRIQ